MNRDALRTDTAPRRDQFRAALGVRIPRGYCQITGNLLSAAMLAFYADHNEGTQLALTEEVLAQKLYLDRKTVRKWRRQLIDQNLLVAQRGPHNSLRCRVNQDLVGEIPPVENPAQLGKSSWGNFPNGPNLPQASWGQFPNCVENHPSFPQKSTSAYIRNARVTSPTLTVQVLRSTYPVSESALSPVVEGCENPQRESEPEIAPPSTKGRSEIVAFVEILLSDEEEGRVCQLDAQVRAHFDSLPAQFRIPEATVCRYIFVKWRSKRDAHGRSRYPIASASAFFSWVEEGLPGWIAENPVLVAQDRLWLQPDRKPVSRAPIASWAATASTGGRL